MELRIVQRTESTNTDLLNALKDGPLPEQYTLLAQEQTQGQGRAGRAWDTSGVQALTFSTVLTPSWPHEMWGWIPLLAGVAVAKTLSIDVPDIAIKWPNDVVIPAADGTHIDGWGPWRKAGGILTQVAERGEQVVVGVGLNLAPVVIGDAAPSLPAPHAAYLFSPGAVGEIGSGSALEFSRQLTGHIVDLLAELTAEAEPNRSLVERMCATLGQSVKIEQIGRETKIAGGATQLAPDGALGIETDEGLVWISSGDVLHIRA